MTKILFPPHLGMELDKDGRAVFIDNLFISFKLLSEMGSKGYVVTGTLRRNRAKGAPLKDIDAEERGTCTAHVGKIDESLVCLVQWRDNKTCLVACNKFDSEPIAQATRYSKSEKKRIPIDCPNCIKLYNSGMGGVDLCLFNLPYSHKKEGLVVQVIQSRLEYRTE